MLYVCKQTSQSKRRTGRNRKARFIILSLDNANPCAHLHDSSVNEEGVPCDAPDGLRAVWVGAQWNNAYSSTHTGKLESIKLASDNLWRSSGFGNRLQSLPLMMKLKQRGPCWMFMKEVVQNFQKQRCRKIKTDCITYHRKLGFPQAHDNELQKQQNSMRGVGPYSCSARIGTFRRNEKTELLLWIGAFRHVVMLKATTFDTCCEITMLLIREGMFLGNFIKL